MPEDYAALARLLLRAEGVASSFIEGVSAPILDIVLAETINRLRTSFAHAALTRVFPVSGRDTGCRWTEVPVL